MRTDMISQNHRAPGNFLKTYGIVILLFFILALKPAGLFAGATIQNLAVSPGSVAAGANVTVTFQFKGDNGGCKVAYMAALSNQCAFQNGGTAGQSILVSESGMDVLNNNVGGGRTSQCNGDSAWHNNTDTPCGMEAAGAPVYMTVPGGWAPGTYYAIVAVKNCNIYANPGLSLEAQACISFTVTGAASPTPTGVQNRANSDANTTNAVAFIVFSPTPTISKTITVSPTATYTMTQTATASITTSLTWTLTPTLTWTLSVTLTPTLTYTPTPPLVIVLTKTIDRHIYSLGDQVNYCLVYTNNGTANANFTVWDTIPLVTDFVSCTNGCSQVIYGPYVVLVWNITGLGVGQSNQVCFVVQVNRLPYLQNGKEYFALFDEKKYPEYSYLMKEDLYTGGKYNMNGFLRQNR